MIDVPETDRRPRSRKVCPHCEATPGACRSREWLSGRWCCEACTGDHDREPAGDGRAFLTRGNGGRHLWH